jgi:hypothetical protein
MFNHVIDITERPPISARWASRVSHYDPPVTTAEVRRVRADEWAELRALRLAALREIPLAFGSTYERELEMRLGLH